MKTLPLLSTWLVVLLATAVHGADLEHSLTAAGVETASLVAAAEGSVVALAWFENDGATRSVRLVLSHDDGETFAPVALTGTARASKTFAKPFLSLVPSARGPALALAYPAEHNGTPGIDWVRSSDGAVVTQRFLPSPDFASPADVAAVAVDSAGNPHSLWLGGTRLFYARGTTDGWQPPVLLDASATACGIATLGRRGTTDMVAIWHRKFDDGSLDFAFARSLDDGATFSAPEPTSKDTWGFTSCPSNSATLLIDRHGAVRFTFAMESADGSPTVFVDRSVDGVTFKPRSFLDTASGFERSRFLQIAADYDGGLAAVLDGYRNERRYVVIRHSLGAPDGSGTLDADWMRPAAPIVLDQSGSGEAPVLASTPTGMVTAWISRKSDIDTVRIRQFTIDQLCGRAPVSAATLQ